MPSSDSLSHEVRGRKAHTFDINKRFRVKYRQGTLRFLKCFNFPKSYVESADDIHFFEYQSSRTGTEPLAAAVKTAQV